VTLLGMESFDIQSFGDLITYGKFARGAGSGGGITTPGRVGGGCYNLNSFDQGQFFPKPTSYYDYDVGSINPQDPTVGQMTLFLGMAFMDRGHTDQGVNGPHWASWLDYNNNLILEMHSDANNFLYFYCPTIGTFLRASKPLFLNRWHYLEIGLFVSPGAGWMELRIDSVAAGSYYGVLAPPTTPVLSQQAGGSWTAQTAWVKTTYVNAQGETVGSASASLAVTANNQLTIASPPPAGVGAGAATGWYAYVGVGGSDPGDAAKYRQQALGSPTAIGSALILPGNPTAAGSVLPTFNTAQAATTRATARGNTQGNALATHGVRWQRLGHPYGNGGQFYNGYYDDVVWFNDVVQSAARPNSNFLGDLRVVGGLPIGPGAHRDFTVGGTAPYGGIGNATTAPTGATAATGGTIPAGAYLVAYSWTNASGETQISATAQVTTAGTTSTITVTPPALPSGATGYHVYMSQPGGGPLTRQSAIPQTAASFTLATPPTTTGGAIPASNTTYPNYQQVNKSPVPGDAAYVQSSTINARDSYQMAPLPAGTLTIYGIMPQAIAKKSDAGARFVAAMFRTAAVLNPTVLPTFSVASVGGTLPAGTYLAGYTWQTSTAETILSPTVTITTVGATSTITLTPPALPAGATGWAPYFTPVGAATPFYQQASQLTAASFTLSAPPAVAAQPPSGNTTALDTNLGLGTSLQNTYGLLTGIVETKPDGTVWTPADVNNVEVGATITV
jgi:hypothetical protein